MQHAVRVCVASVADSSKHAARSSAPSASRTDVEQAVCPLRAAHIWNPCRSTQQRNGGNHQATPRGGHCIYGGLVIARLVQQHPRCEANHLAMPRGSRCIRGELGEYLSVQQRLQQRCTPPSDAAWCVQHPRQLREWVCASHPKVCIASIADSSRHAAAPRRVSASGDTYGTHVTARSGAPSYVPGHVWNPCRSMQPRACVCMYVCLYVCMYVCCIRGGLVEARSTHHDPEGGPPMRQIDWAAWPLLRVPTPR
jgi:hypothetical protein